MKYIQSFLLVCLIFCSLSLRAGEGMWLPHLLAALNGDDMKAMGMKISVEDIYNVNKGSMKDAIVHFGGFCTGEIISDQGLVLTNHHCGYSAIQSHSSVDNNLMRDGFWANDKSQELSNPGLYVRFIVRIEDVTEKALKGLKRKMSPEERQSLIDKNLNGIRENYPTMPFEEVMIRPFFKGNQYILFITKVYNDVRLVGAPPEAIGKYGHDTDNWVWPRHTGDFSMFRIYMAPNGDPADYNENNIPMKPKYALPISVDGVEEGDFTLVFGFPGRTQEYLPGKAMDITANQINLARIGIRESAMKVMDAAMKADEATNIKYASKYASLTNYWKKWIGESNGLKSSNALAKKQEYEHDLNERISRKRKLRKKYGDVLPNLNEVYDKMAPFLVAQTVQSEIFNRNIESIKLGNIAQRLLNIYENNGEEAFQNAAPRYKAYLEKQYKNFEEDVDIAVFSQLMKDYIKYMPSKFLSLESKKRIKEFSAKVNKKYRSSSPSLNPDLMLDILSDGNKLKQALSKDPVRKFVDEIEANYQEKVADKMATLESKRSNLMRRYMDAQMKALPNKKFYPDANGTLRVTYGKVKGYEPRDGVTYHHVTYMEGVMEKYKPGDWEFDLPQKLIDLYESKDYGNYASNGKLAICFIGTNHTTGGNSGSPAIDAHGNLIGLNFDRTWESTMSDMNYDATICRNIMVDIRYILFIIDKYAGAQNLIQELNLVHPKG